MRIMPLFPAPYGIRESTERVGTFKNLKVNEEGVKQQVPAAQHFPSKISYSLSDVFRDLINFAATHMVIGGRLVFWLPVFRYFPLIQGFLYTFHRAECFKM